MPRHHKPGTPSHRPLSRYAVARHTCSLLERGCEPTSAVKSVTLSAQSKLRCHVLTTSGNVSNNTFQQPTPTHTHRCTASAKIKPNTACLATRGTRIRPASRTAPTQSPADGIYSTRSAARHMVSQPSIAQASMSRTYRGCNVKEHVGSWNERRNQNGQRNRKGRVLCMSESQCAQQRTCASQQRTLRRTAATARPVIVTYTSALQTLRKSLKLVTNGTASKE